MGMFDSVYVKCDECEESIEFQSKAGNCSLASYSPETAPFVILADIDGNWDSCKNGHSKKFEAKLRRTTYNFCPNCGHHLQ